MSKPQFNSLVMSWEQLQTGNQIEIKCRPCKDGMKQRNIQGAGRRRKGHLEEGPHTRIPWTLFLKNEAGLFGQAKDKVINVQINITAPIFEERKVHITQHFSMYSKEFINKEETSLVRHQTMLTSLRRETVCLTVLFFP